MKKSYLLGTFFVCIIVIIFPALSFSERDDLLFTASRLETEDLKGVLPYESQYVGTYQPILGWKGRTNTRWVDRQIGVAMRLLEIELGAEMREKISGFDGSMSDPIPAVMVEPRYGVVRRALENTPNFTSRVRAARTAKPESPNKASIVDKMLSKPNPGEIQPPGGGDSVPDKKVDPATELMNTVSKNHLLRGYLGRSLDYQAAKYQQRLNWIDSIDTESQQGGYIVSPIGVIHLYRQYFFDFGTFLGPPVEHVWIAPGSSVELLEVSSQSEYRFIESEESLQLIDIDETESRAATELSEQMNRETKHDLKVGISAEGGANFGVVQASASSSLNYGLSLAKSKSEARKQTNETKSKASKELRRTQRTLTRASTTKERTSSRKHVIENPTDKLLNYELRRKYRKVGIQLQHLGTQLAWQFYLDEPGMGVGLAELVHVAKPEDFSTLPPADQAPPTFEAHETDYTFTIPYRVTKGDGDDNGTFKKGKKDGDKIQYIFYFEAPIPETGYELSSVTQTDFQRTTPDHDRPSRWALDYTVEDPASGRFKVTLVEVNFEKQPAVKVFVKLVWNVSEDIRTKAIGDYQENIAEFDRVKQREAQEHLVDALRERVELARSVQARPEDELRSEERAILYRRTIDNLVGNEVGPALHATAEIMRTYFELDKMLYFVAPDWWNPRFNRNRGGITRPALPAPGQELEDLGEISLSDSNRVRFGNEHANRDNNYFITEDSEAAPLGSSIGWLLQLDGDPHRNAFLNAAWAKVVVPIRRGYETEALEWLKKPHVEDADGLDATAYDASGNPMPKLNDVGEAVLDEDGNTVNMSIEEAIVSFAEQITGETENKVYLASQKMFQEGFQPLGEDTVVLSGDSFDVFAEWLEIVPTNQIAPVEYTP